MPDPMENEQGTVTGTEDHTLVNDQQDHSTGKHLLFMVPDFTNTVGRNVSNTPLNSYLRLGMAHSQAGPAVTTGPKDKQHSVRTDLGEDLAVMVLGFTDDSRERGTGSGAAPGIPTDAQNQEAPQGTDHGANYRVDESKVLHSKGGWRDHSDGNRISTTRGDKIEIIRGNYKLLVLGRQDDPTTSVAGFDNSGGQIDTDGGDLVSDGSTQSGLNQSWEWDGTRWNVTILQGAQASTSNPTMTNKTFAHKMDTEVTADNDITNSTTSIFGSITNSAHAPGTITNDNHANTSMVNTTSSGNIFNNTASGAMETFQEVGFNIIGNVLSVQLQADVAEMAMIYAQATPIILTEYASAINASFTQASAITNFQLAAAGITSNQVASAAILSTQTAASITNLNQAALMTNTMTGVSVDAHVGVHIDNHPGAHADNHSGVHMDIHSGVHIQAEDVEAKTVKLSQVESIVGPHFRQLTTAINTTSGTAIEIATAMFKL
jgi:hypothetical protein